MTIAGERRARQTRPRGQPLRRRAHPLRLARVFQRGSADLLALLILGVALGVLLLYAALPPPTALAFDMDRQPPRTVIRGFYGLERNAAGAYRWSKPGASLTLPVAAPGTYRVTLALGDSPAALPRRPVTVAINGAEMGTFTLDDTVREITFERRLAPAEWAGDGERALQVEVYTDPFVPPGDPRALGVILGRVAVEPVPPARPAWAPLFGPALLLLTIAYAAARLAGLGRFWTVALLAAPLALFGALAFTARETALVAAYQPAAQSHLFLSLALSLALLPAIVRAVARPQPAAWGERRGAWESADDEDGSSPSRSTPRARSRGALALASVTALAAGLRLYHLDRLSLWLDEGATLHYSSLPWPAVLGLQGYYDTHPPLFYALVKLVATVVPDTIAGRLVSAIAGALTVPVLYALTARLVNARAAAVAALVLALSPLHIWYSQEARMYAPNVLLVALSYLALVAFQQAPGTRWAILYGVTLPLALYNNYSAVFALAPQALLLASIARTHGRRAGALWGAAAAGVLAFLPWLPQVVGSVTSGRYSQMPFLHATPARIANSLLSLIGLKHKGADFFGVTFPAPWDRWPDWRGAIVLGIVPAVVLGAAVLARRAPLAPLVAASLSLGTVLAALAIAAIAPSYAERTVLPATLGWALLVGAAASRERLPQWLDALGLLSVAIVLALSAASLGALYHGAEKQHYREFATAIAATAATGQPVIATTTFAPAFVEAYAPWAGVDRAALANGGRDIRALAGVTEADSVWLAYADYGWEEQDTNSVRGQLAALGYERVEQRYFPHPLHLDRYARPGAWEGAAR